MPRRDRGEDGFGWTMCSCMLAYLVIWEALAAGVQLGTVRAGDRKLRQLAPMDAYTRKLLAAAGCSIGPKERERMRVA